MGQEVLAELMAGKFPQDIMVSKKVGVLRDHTVHWLWMAYNALNKTNIVKKVCCSYTHIILLVLMCDSCKGMGDVSCQRFQYIVQMSDKP